MKPVKDKASSEDLQRRDDALAGIGTFLSRQSRTLLIKGEAGTGKTTLAIQLLEKFGQGKGVYLSTRVSSDKISADMPWTGVSIGTKTQFHDLRLGSAAVFVTDFIETLHKGEAPPIVVFDSWDAIAKELDEKQRQKTEKSIFALADNSTARVVFTSEEPERSTLDYLVDGVVELTRVEISERMFREVEIKKLRGIPIEQHRYLFTLDGGRFGIIWPYRAPDYSLVRKFRGEPIPDNDEGYSFGAPCLDDIFGGIHAGGIFTLEYTEKVPSSAIRAITFPAMVNALRLGRSIFLVPLAGASPHNVLNILSRASGLSKSELAERVRIQVGQMDGPSAIFTKAPDSLEEQRREVQTALDEIRKNSVDRSVLLVQAVSALENRFATRLNSFLESLSGRVTKTQNTSDALLLVVQNDSPIRTRVLAMSYDYASIQTKDKSVILYGEKRGTGAYALQHSADHITPVLTPIL